MGKENTVSVTTHWKGMSIFLVLMFFMLSMVSLFVAAESIYNERSIVYKETVEEDGDSIVVDTTHKTDVDTVYGGWLLASIAFGLMSLLVGVFSVVWNKKESYL